MAEFSCKKCGPGKCVKNGLMNEKQRYRCKDCFYNFTLRPRRGKHPVLKALAIFLYASARVTMSKITRVMKVSEVVVYK